MSLYFLVAADSDPRPSGSRSLTPRVRFAPVNRTNVGPSRGTMPHMGTPKEELRRLLEKLPDDVSFEDIQYHIYVQQAVERGLEAVEKDEVISQEEVERRMARWLGE